MSTLIKNASVVLPHETAKTNVLVVDGRIASIDAPATATADEVVDAAGMHLLPGVIDDQVHFRDPGLTHKEDLFTASRACAKGGVTSFLEMPNTVPNTTSQAVLEAKLALAKHKSVVNYGFYIGATPENAVELVHAHRTPGIKIFIGSSTGNLLVDEQEALERIFSEGSLPITAHCEDESTIRENRARLERDGKMDDIRSHSVLRDARCAMVATQRALDLAFRHKRRFHVLHVSTGDETALFADHRGLITAEACPHHLFFNTDDYARLGTRVQMNPSVKSADDSARLWDALHANLIQVIATDHAPHTLAEKARPYPSSPSGVPAVENSLALLLNEAHHGRVTLGQIAHWMADAPARVWGMVGKGRIAEGYDADLVLCDLAKQVVVRNEGQLTKCGWTPWDGSALTGWPVRTWCGGVEVFRAEGRSLGEVRDGVRGAECVFDPALGGYWATEDGVGPRAVSA